MSISTDIENRFKRAKKKVKEKVKHGNANSVEYIMCVPAMVKCEEHSKIWDTRIYLFIYEDNIISCSICPFLNDFPHPCHSYLQGVLCITGFEIGDEPLFYARHGVFGSRLDSEIVQWFCCSLLSGCTLLNLHQLLNGMYGWYFQRVGKFNSNVEWVVRFFVFLPFSSRHWLRFYFRIYVDWMCYSCVLICRDFLFECVVLLLFEFSDCSSVNFSSPAFILGYMWIECVIHLFWFLVWMYVFAFLFFFYFFGKFFLSWLLECNFFLYVF